MNFCSLQSHIRNLFAKPSSDGDDCLGIALHHRCFINNPSHVRQINSLYILKVINKLFMTFSMYKQFATMCINGTNCVLIDSCN